MKYVKANTKIGGIRSILLGELDIVSAHRWISSALLGKLAESQIVRKHKSGFCLFRYVVLWWVFLAFFGGETGRGIAIKNGNTPFFFSIHPPDIYHALMLSDSRQDQESGMPECVQREINVLCKKFQETVQMFRILVWRELSFQAMSSLPGQCSTADCQTKVTCEL